MQIGLRMVVKIGLYFSFERQLESNIIRKSKIEFENSNIKSRMPDYKRENKTASWLPKQK